MNRASGFGTGVAAAMAAVIIWGAQVPVAKAAYQKIDPYSLMAIRYLVAALLLMAFLAFRQGVQAFSLGARPYRLAFAGVLGMAGSPLLFFVGLAYTQPEHAVIIVALQPTLAALAQWWLRGRRPAAFTLGAIAVAFAGVVLVVAARGAGTTDSTLFGDILVFAGAFCWLSYTMMLAGFPGFGALRFTTLTCGFGTLAILIVTGLAYWSGQAGQPSLPALVAVGPHLIFLSVFGVALSMLIWNYGNAHIGALNSMLLVNLMPVVTYSIRYLEGARFGWHEWTGAALVIAALLANNLYERTKGAAA